MIVAIILAAGRSVRMGTAKALLPQPHTGTNFVTHLIRSIREAGVETILVVGRAEDQELRHAVLAANAEFVINPEPDRGQLSSLVTALDGAERRHGADAILVMPVDVALISTGAIRRVLQQTVASDAPIVRAVHDGRHGHPVIFRKRVFDELREAEPSIGAKAVMRRDPSRVLDVEVDDRGATVDIDTPEDYAREFGDTR